MWRKKRRCLWPLFSHQNSLWDYYYLLAISASLTVQFIFDGDSWGKLSIMRFLFLKSSAPQDIFVRFLCCLPGVCHFVSSKMNLFFLGQRRLKRFICKQISYLDHPLALGGTFGKRVWSDSHLRWPLHHDANPVLSTLYLSKKCVWIVVESVQIPTTPFKCPLLCGYHIVPEMVTL